MPKVSVVMPTYNRAHFIGEAIQSVLDQSFKDFEIIVIDDGSTDNTKEVVDSFQDHRIKYMYQRNCGVSAARNNGIQASNGEHIAFLDSDDLLLENALEKGGQILARYPEVGFSYGQAYLIDGRGSVFGLRLPKQKHSYVRGGSEEIREFLVRGNYIPTSTVITRRSCLFDVGLFNPAFRSGSEDLDLWVRLAKRYAVAYIAEPLVKYCVHSGSILTGRKLDELKKSHSVIFEGVFNDAALGPLLSSERPKTYFHLHLHLANKAYGTGEMKTAREHLFKALKIYPKGFFKGLWLPWIFQFVKTWLPLRVLELAQRGKHRLRIVAWCTVYRFLGIGKISTPR